MAPGQTTQLINGYFNITYVRNPGGAFGLMPSGQLFFLAASGAVIVMILGYKVWRRPESAWTNLAVGLILGGTAGNLIDRLSYGEVIDWLDFRIWPVFNVADMALVIGLGLFSIQIIRSNRHA